MSCQAPFPLEQGPIGVPPGAGSLSSSDLEITGFSSHFWLVWVSRSGMETLQLGWREIVPSLLYFLTIGELKSVMTQNWACGPELVCSFLLLSALIHIYVYLFPYAIGGCLLTMASVAGWRASVAGEGVCV